MEKKEYIAPSVRMYGDVEQITKANNETPTVTDAIFPAGTAWSDLTGS